LLEDRVLPVPQGQGEAEELPIIRDPGEPVLAPAIGPPPRLVMAEVVPGIARVAVVLADRAPLPLSQIGTPALPIALAITVLHQSLVLECVRHVRASSRYSKYCERCPIPGLWVVYPML